MGKKKKLYNLRANISRSAMQIKYLLENAIYKADSEIEALTLGEIALDLVEGIAKKSEKIGKILKH